MNIDDDLMGKITNDYVIGLMSSDKIVKKYGVSQRWFKSFSKNNNLSKLKKENERLKRCDEFISRAKDKYGDRFDYSMVRETFINYRTKVTILDEKKNSHSK